jgi:hypothetical protein
MRATRNAQGVGRSASARYSRMAPNLAALAFTRICTEVQQVASHCRPGPVSSGTSARQDRGG